jgi:hypothetical protein
MDILHYIVQVQNNKVILEWMKVQFLKSIMPSIELIKIYFQKIKPNNLYICIYIYIYIHQKGC